MKKLFLLSLSIVFALSVFAQWDDVYYNPKKKDPTAVRTQSARGRSTYKNQSSDEGLYEKQIRDANDKNRVTVIDRTVDNCPTVSMESKWTDIPSVLSTENTTI